MYWIRGVAVIYIAVLFYGIYGLKNNDYQKILNASTIPVSCMMFIEGAYERSVKTKLNPNKQTIKS